MGQSRRGSRKITDAGSSERYQLLVSDGCHLNEYALPARHLNDKLTSGELSVYSIVRMNHLFTSMVKKLGRPEMCVMIIHDLTILAKGSEVRVIIGNPVALPEGGFSTAALPAPTGPAITSLAESRIQANVQDPPTHSRCYLRWEITLLNFHLQLTSTYSHSLVPAGTRTNEGAHKTHESLLTLSENLAPSNLVTQRFSSVIQNLLVENVALAHIVTKQERDSSLQELFEIVERMPKNIKGPKL
ncbi:uncharacterized protein LOC126210222 [Schistocerca nitens]|uniref:uncharacterized protein LOC126210222 n=1 Tax=Schistocerca nitens TaxID=7011 RepID=UPI0021197E88|nr:uncharacterized protein LOC126210222 [Schistocerca nitens]